MVSPVSVKLSVFKIKFIRFYIFTFKFDIPQVLREVVKCYFEPLIELFGKFSDNLSQTVDERKRRHS